MKLFRKCYWSNCLKWALNDSVPFSCSVPCLNQEKNLCVQIDHVPLSPAGSSWESAVSVCSFQNVELHLLPLLLWDTYDKFVNCLILSENFSGWYNTHQAQDWELPTPKPCSCASWLLLWSKMSSQDLASAGFSVDTGKADSDWYFPAGCVYHCLLDAMAIDFGKTNHHLFWSEDMQMHVHCAKKTPTEQEKTSTDEI